MRKTLLGAVIMATMIGLPAQAADWVIDQGKSTLGFEGKQADAMFSGRFSSWKAEISFDPANPAAGRAKVTIDMASATTGEGERDAALPGDDWFDVKHFPQASFVAEGFRAKGGNGFEALGRLTIRGVGKDVVLPFTLDLDGDKAHAKGRLPLLRTDYGVGQGMWRSGQIVGVEAAVTVDLVATARH